VGGQSQASGTSSTGSSSTASPTDGAVFVVHRQPLALDRFAVNDVRPRDAAGAREKILPNERSLFHRGVFRCIKRAGRNGISAAEKLRSIFGRVKTCEVRHRSGNVTITIEICTNGAKTL